MYIDTTDACSIIYSIGKILSIDRMQILELCYEENESKFREFLLKHFNEEMINEILIHHLSRRIDGVETISDLHATLLTNNAMSEYLAEKGINFKEGINELELYYRGKKVDINSCPSILGVNKSRIKQRFCTNNKIDFSDSMINGYVIGDVEKETTYHCLACSPEIITDLSQISIC